MCGHRDGPGPDVGSANHTNSRVRPEDLLINRVQGIEWLSRNHGIAPEVIREVFAFYDAHKSRRAGRIAAPA
jgi:hypothetical protein